MRMLSNTLLKSRVIIALYCLIGAILVSGCTKPTKEIIVNDPYEVCDFPDLPICAEGRTCEEQDTETDTAQLFKIIDKCRGLLGHGNK